MPRTKGTRGRYVGIQYANIHYRIANIISMPEGGVDHRLLMHFKDDYSLDDLLDIEEIIDVGKSWRDAAQANLDARMEQRREEKR